ncbi:mechanosensitive ion channel domain-containing protein [Uliginosibacterium sp. 31-12]|uniref:mechanosensitive ion channel domain-containing protein n=1 Tax=Uliginosibacterium sp. 31-12 TaxID=3062781 RepID=UPI0026E24706|nr:mechanosensitive ion channel domain-containing protein [Uliginosibacterium sp. 31-12]MDO6387184.1 mechanosensitive ion channel [Uliginosibacterium sp. 31-12]
MKRLALLASSLLCCGLLSAPTGAQSLLKLLPHTAAPQSAPVSQAEDTASRISRLREKQAALLKILQRLEAPDGLASGAPSDATAAELDERHLRIAFSVSLIDRQLADLARLAKVRASRAALDKEIHAWSGLSETPPYPIRLLDRFRAERDNAQQSLTALRARETLVKTFSERTSREVKESEARIRKLTESAERRFGLGASPGHQGWARELSQIQLQTAQIAAATLQTIGELQEAELGVAQDQLQFARRKLELASADYRFSAEEFATINNELDADFSRIEQRRTALAQQQLQRSNNAELAQARLEQLRNRGDTSPQLTEAARSLELANARVEASTYGGEFLRGMADAQRLHRRLWNARYQGLHRDETSDRLEAGEALETVRPFISMWRRGLEQQRTVLDLRLQRLDALLADTSDPLAQKHLIALRNAAEEALPLQRSAYSLLESMEALLVYTDEELGTARKELSASERLDEWQLRLTQWAQAAWNYELMTVEDVIEVDGNKITGKRSITIGKVLAALLAFVAGIIGCLLFARQICRLLISRLGWSDSNARILRRWLLTVEFMVLGIIVLAWARIPLTVFAFLGGAIAIGAGFAMQTLLKNLMSGVMILGERPFRPGDIIEIGGISGTVMDIGIRASTLRDANGIETIVPNASFIEQNLTNWTYSSPRVRFTVRVGVAYGAPVKRVIELLDEAAQRHGLILKDPAPEVIFEDFGADAQVFALHYWLEMGPNVTSRVVASDLRRMIEHTFSEQGIVIAYPQRDVHLDASQPLPVTLVSPVRES